jgi:ATP-grasp domain
MAWKKGGYVNDRDCLWELHRVTKRFVVPDPHQPYATCIVDVVRERWGLLPVFVHSDPKERFWNEDISSAIGNSAADNINVGPGGLQACAEEIRKRFGEVAGVVPLTEKSLSTSVRLASALGVGWCDPTVLDRFRNKFALKEYLRTANPQLGINYCQLIRAPHDILSSGHVPARFVLKPNDGFGNRNIGFFTSTSPLSDLESFFASAPPGVAFLLEEFLDGDEYFVNGQVDALGRCEVIAIFRYSKVAANGRAGLDHLTWRIRSDVPVFATLEQYAHDVIAASGLRRSPFHLEVILGDQGPSLVDAGARLPGNGNVLECNRLHGRSFDWFQLAAHYYLQDADFGPLSLNWAHYDSLDVLYVHGIATQDEIVCDVDGVEQVEALPEFVRWARKPGVGNRVVPTVDMFTAPWCAVLAGNNGLQELIDRAEQVRAVLRWNLRSGPLDQIAARSRWIARKAIKKICWHSHEIGADRQFESGRWRRSLHEVVCLLHRSGNVAIRWAQTIGFRHHSRNDGLVSPRRLKLVQEVMRWTDRYLAEPHAQLGRNGPICPFIKRAVAEDRVFIAIHDEIDGRSRARLRSVLLDRTDELLERFPEALTHGTVFGVVIVFPNLPEYRAILLDKMHAEMKSFLMARGVMLSPFHPRCQKPARWNPSFEVSRAPFAGLVIRHMAPHDIVFVSHNRKAFQGYRKRFGHLYDDGKMANESGYVDEYSAALKRFGRQAAQVPPQ